MTQQTDKAEDERVERLLDYVDVLEDCFGYALALLAASTDEQREGARAALSAAMERGPNTQIRAAEAGVIFRDPSIRNTPPIPVPGSNTQH